MMWRWLALVWVAAARGFRVDTGGRQTSLYRAQGPPGRNNVIITAKPQVIRSAVDLNGLGFPILDCDPSHPCSQSFSVNSQAMEQLRGLGATSPLVDPDTEIPYNGYSNADQEKHKGLFSVIEDSFYKTKHGISQQTQRPHGKQRPSQQVYANQITQPASHPNSWTQYETPTRPENQEPAAYASILDSRIGVVANSIMDFTESDVDKEQEHHVGSVSVASSHGRIKGPNYPFRPTQPPATAWTSRTERPRRTTEPPAQLFATPDLLTDDGAASYYAVTLRPDRYDPFSYQSSKTKAPQWGHRGGGLYTRVKPKVANAMDSRHSVGVPSYRDKPKSKQKTYSDIISSYESRKQAADRDRDQVHFHKAQPAQAYRPRLSTAESARQYNYANPPPSTYKQVQQKQTAKPYFPRKQEVAGYQGGETPIFVSLDEAERRVLPTLPARNYFPVKDSQTSKYWYDPPATTITPELRRPTQYHKRPSYDYPIQTTQRTYRPTEHPLYDQTRPLYEPPYETTRPSEEQKLYWQTKATQRPQQIWQSNGLYEVGNNYNGYKEAPSALDTNKYIGQPQLVATGAIIVGPGIESDEAFLRQPPTDMVSSYSDRYGWTENANRDYNNNQVKSNQALNWTSLDLAKPVWEDETVRPVDLDREYKIGSAQPIQLENLNNWDQGNKDTYGSWDDQLNLLPALSRSTDPQPKEWVLVAKSRSLEEGALEAGHDGNLTGVTTVGISVDAPRFQKG